MGLSSLTRYNLFMESGDLIESGEGIVRFRDYLYDIGSVAEIKGLNNEQYFILGLTYFDNELRAHVEKEDYIKAIASLVKYISERSQGFPTYMPVIGTGGADVGSANDLAVYIVKTIELFKDKIDCDIHIVVRDKEEKIGLMNLKML